MMLSLSAAPIRPRQGAHLGSLGNARSGLQVGLVAPWGGADVTIVSVWELWFFVAGWQLAVGVVLVLSLFEGGLSDPQ